MTTKEAIAKAPAGRARRTPIGQRNVLTVTGKEPGYEYRFVNDVGDRIQEFQDNGWETVEQKSVRIGDKRIDKATSDGSLAKASVGQGTSAYVMRIKEDWYKEDQAAKNAHVDQTEAAMKEKALTGTYGKLEITSSR